MIKIFHSFLLSVTVIQSSAMILNHGPVVITFDLDKCRKSNSCDAIYSTNNLNPTQLTIANIEFNAKNNKIGKIKINTTPSNTSDKEINKNRTDIMNMRENKNRTEAQSNPATSSNNLEFNNTNHDFTTKRRMIFNETHELSAEEGYKLTKVNNSRKLTDDEKRTMDWYPRLNTDNDTVSGNKPETAKTNNTKLILKDNSDIASNRTSSLNNEDLRFTEFYSNLIDSNEHTMNKLNNNITKSYMVKNKINTDIKKIETNKLDMNNNNTQKSNMSDKNKLNITQLKPIVNNYDHKSDTQNITDRISKTNNTNMKITYMKTTNQSHNLQSIGLNDTKSKLHSNIKNNQILKDISVNGTETILLNITQFNTIDTTYNISMKHLTEGKNGSNLQIIGFNDNKRKLHSNVKNDQGLKNINVNKNQTTLFNITKLIATDTKYNISTKQSTEGKNGNDQQVIGLNNNKTKLYNNIKNDQSLKNISVNGNQTTLLNIIKLNATDTTYNMSIKQSTAGKQGNDLHVIGFNINKTKLHSNVKNYQSLKNISVNGNQTILLKITKLNATDTKYNMNMKQSTEGKKGNNSKIAWNRISKFIINSTEMYKADHLLSTVGLFYIGNDKHDSGVKNQTDAFEFDIDGNNPTTEFSADAYYKNLYNNSVKIKKTALDSFNEIDKVSRSKRTHEFEAFLSRMVSTLP